jgi:DnaJ-class molecular chaperone
LSILFYFIPNITQLGVAVDADDTELKKAYRKQAMKV